MMPKNQISDCLIYCLILAALAVVVVNSTTDPVIVPRSGWNARPPKAIDEMANPVPYVVIHHSYMPPCCNTSAECIKAMQWMQDYHQDNHSWVDIGYHFAVGGDGKAYEGRGWSRVGAHAPYYNNISIGICVIGDWTENLPPEQQLKTVHELIAMGVTQGKIKENYQLFGHRQVREGTVCPGDRLYDEIKTWPHYSTTPEYIWHVKKEETHTHVPPYEDNKLKKKRTVSFLSKLK